MKKIMTYLSVAILMALFVASDNFNHSKLYAQNTNSEKVEHGLQFEKKDVDFGKFSINSGPKKCVFKFKNISDKAIVINHVLSSCGCTTPEWSRKPIQPGEGGEIKVTFLNDQGPIPFEKSLTVYTSGYSKPIILTIRGVVTK